VAEAFRRLRNANPNPTTELEYASPFQLLVAVVLSAQATDKGVNSPPASSSPSPPPRRPWRTWAKPASPSRSRPSASSATRPRTPWPCRTSFERHGGEVPNDRDALEALPGVGRKTANVVLNTIFGEPTMAVDTHIFRLANRTGLAPGKDVSRSRSACCAASPRNTCATPTTG
jgi:endonuclease-3